MMEEVEHTEREQQQPQQWWVVIRASMGFDGRLHLYVLIHPIGDGAVEVGRPVRCEDHHEILARRARVVQQRIQSVARAL